MREAGRGKVRGGAGEVDISAGVGSACLIDFDRYPGGEGTNR